MADGYLNFDTKINESGFNEGINKLGSLGKSGLSVVSKAMTGAVAAVGAGAAAIVKSSLGVVANMEQQVGGVETLFKDSAKTVIRNANNGKQRKLLQANIYLYGEMFQGRQNPYYLIQKWRFMDAFCDKSYFYTS